MHIKEKRAHERLKTAARAQQIAIVDTVTLVKGLVIKIRVRLVTESLPNRPNLPRGRGECNLPWSSFRSFHSPDSAINRI